MNKPVQLGGAGGKKAPKILKDNLFSKDVVEFTLGLCEGPIGGLVSGGQSFYLDDTPLVSASGDINFEPFELHLYTGQPDASQVRNVLGGISSNQTVSVQLSTNTSVVRVTPSSLANTIDQLEVRLQINQLVRATNKGDQLNATVDFRIEYREAGTSDWRNFTSGTPQTRIVGYEGVENSGDKGGWSNTRTPIYETYTIPNYRVTGKTTGGYTRDFVKKVPRIDGDWEVRVTLLTPTDDPLISIAMTWESLQSVTTEHRSYDHLAVARGLGQASDQFSGIPKFSGVYACLLVKVPSNFDPVTRHYSGLWDGTFKIAHTDDPAWILYDVYDNPIHGMRKHVPDLLLDRYSFYEASRWCNELVPIPGGAGFQPRYTYNGYTQNVTNGHEMAVFMASAFNALVLTDMNGSIRLVVDKPENIVQLFGPESVSEEGFSYQFTDIMQRYNDIEVEFINPDLGWEPDRRRVFDQELIDANGNIPLKMVAVGCISVYEAERRALLRMIQANTELSTVTFQTARAGISLDLFDMVGITDPDMQWGVSGRILSRDGTTIHLRDPLTLPANTPLGMELQTISGPVTLSVTSPDPVTRTLTLNDPWPVDTPEQAQFAIVSPGGLGLVKPFRIVAIKPSDDNAEAITITAVEVNQNKYGDADGMESSGTIGYNGQSNRIPLSPVLTRIESGTGQLLRQAGVVTSRIRLEWVTDPRSFIREVQIFYRQVDGGEFQMLSSTGTQIYLSGVQDGETYEVYLVAVNHSGQRSAPSGILAHQVVGKTAPPLAPTGITASAALGAIWLTWDVNTEADFSHNEIIVRDSTVTVTDATPADYTVDSNQFIESSLPESTARVFWVRSVDSTGNRSAWSEPVGATSSSLAAAGTTPPMLEQFVVNSVLSPSGESLITATWISYNVPSFEIGITREGGNEVVHTTGIDSYERVVVANVNYSVRVRSVSSLGAKSAWTPAQEVLAVRDQVPPATPTGLLARPSIEAIALTWTANTEADFEQYGVYESLTSTAPTDVTEATYSLGSNIFTSSGLTGGVRYYYWVRAFDTSGNQSPWSAVASAETIAIIPLVNSTVAPEIARLEGISTGIRTDHDNLAQGVTDAINTIDTDIFNLQEDLSAFELDLSTLSGDLTTISADLSSVYDSVSGQVRSAALSGFLNSAEFDQAVSARIDSFEAEILTPAGQIRGTLLTGYYTSAQADSAISAAQTTLRSEMATNQNAALAAAQAASNLAGSMGKVFFQNAAPPVAERLAQNLWIDTTGGNNTPKRWTGSAWVAVTDKAATDAAAAAAAAQTGVNTINSNLSTNYYTRVATDTAIAAAQTALQTNINGLSSTLTNDYYTRVATDSAISAAQTTLRSEMSTNQNAALAAAQAASNLAGGKGKVIIQNTAPAAADRLAQNLWIDTTGGNNTPKRWVSGSTWAAVTDKAATDAAAAAAAAQLSANTVSANLSTNYLTTVQTNSAISSAIDSFEAEILTPAGQVRATLLTGYYTSAQADSAIATSSTVLEAQLRGSVADLPFTFQAGLLHWTTNINALGPETPGAASTAGLTLVTNDTQFAVCGERTVTASGQGLFTRGVVRGGRRTYRLRARFKVMSTSSGGAIALNFGARRLDDNFASLGISSLGSATSANFSPSATEVYEHTATISYAAGSGIDFALATLEQAAWLRFCFRMNTASVTAVLRIVEFQVEDVTDVLNLNATVTQHGVALVNIDNIAQASYVIRAQAGGAVSLLDLVAADDGVTPPTSIARLSADLILLDGTVGTDKLVVGMGRNLLENSNWRAGTTGWNVGRSGTNGGAPAVTFGIRSGSGNWSSLTAPTGVIEQTTANAGGWTEIESRPVISESGATTVGYPVSPGQVVEASAYLSAHRCRGEVRIRFFDSAGASLQYSSVLGFVENDAGSQINPDLWQRVGGRFVAPPGAVSATTHIRKNGTLSGSNSYLFIHKPQLCISHAAATQLTPYSPPGTTMISGGQLMTNSISTDKLGANSVTTGKLAAGAVTADHIFAGALNANVIGAGQMSSEFLTVETAMTIDEENAGFRMGKVNASDTADGLYMGRTQAADGSVGFGFMVGRTDDDGQQFIQATKDDGLTIVNSKFFRDLSISFGTQTVNWSTGNTRQYEYALSAAATHLDLDIIGGGRAGRASDNVWEGVGTASLVQLYNGTTFTGHSWVSQGATGFFPGSIRGQDSATGSGGRGGYMAIAQNGTPYPVPALQGLRGAGGGGWDTGDGGGGGLAAQLVTVRNFDIGALGLANPRLRITIGAGGTVTNQDLYSGGHGGEGEVKFSSRGGALRPADVVPLAPTASGEMTNAPGSFPNHGAGFWVISTRGTVAAIGMTEVIVDEDGNSMRPANAASASFFSSITPVITAAGTIRTLDYIFYKMGP